MGISILSLTGTCPGSPGLQVGSRPIGRQEGAPHKRNYLAGKPFDLLRAVSGSIKLTATSLSSSFVERPRPSSKYICF
jgi:hypothetical protein